MQDKMLDMIREVSSRIENGRTLQSIFEHGAGELQELRDEIQASLEGRAPGKDGIVGEAIDVILCMVDIIYERDPGIINDEILTIVANKLEKWERVYGNKEKENE